MSRPLQRDALRIIQDIVREATGSALQAEARRRLESVLKSLAAGDVPDSAGQGFSQREVTILFADLRGFSAIAASHPAEMVLGVLNRCFAAMVDIIERHYGTIDKFMGDAIMVIFTGDAAAPRDHARRALLCAVEMQIAMNELRRRHQEEGVPEMYLGIGMSTGHVMAGLIGSDAYRAYTVIGEEVNLASRIEALSLRGQVLMSETTYAHCRDFVHVGEPMEVHVKGKSERMRIREALGIPALGKVVPRQDVRKSPRVEVRLDLDYWSVEGKAVRGEGSRGVIRDLGYRGLAAELERRLPLYSEVKLAFDLSFLGFRASDVYGRVVASRADGERFLIGVEFTSLDAQTQSRIELFVQMLLQGEYREIN
ncbi:MAG TPA: adenylate/guanylate cyclase domain-containing protein [Burkholderiales bacterium]